MPFSALYVSRAYPVFDAPRLESVAGGMAALCRLPRWLAAPKTPAELAWRDALFLA